MSWKQHHPNKPGNIALDFHILSHIFVAKIPLPPLATAKTSMTRIPSWMDACPCRIPWAPKARSILREKHGKNMGRSPEVMGIYSSTRSHFFGILGPRISTSLEYSWFKRPSSAPPSKPKSMQRLRTRPSGHHQQCGYEHHIIRLIYGYLWWIYKWIYIYDISYLYIYYI